MLAGFPNTDLRLYIVGITAAMQKSKFQFPTDVPMQPLTKFITGPAAAQGNLPGSMTHLKNYLDITNAAKKECVDLKYVIGDIGSQTAHWTVGYSP